MDNNTSIPLAEHRFQLKLTFPVENLSFVAELPRGRTSSLQHLQQTCYSLCCLETRYYSELLDHPADRNRSVTPTISEVPASDNGTEGGTFAEDDGVLCRTHF